MTRTTCSLLLVTGMIAAGSTAAFARDSPGNAPRVDTRHGPIRGGAHDGVEDFFGIPFAAPPVDALRWMPPQPVTDWSEPLDGATHGALCPQNDSLDSLRVETEDCLYLNVQRPEGTTEGDALPVLVYIHGGSWETGSGNIEDLGALVREGGIVGVAMNYRLGLLGSLAHPALANGDDVGNYSLMDQVAALRWVEDNIAAFGGDPATVTVAGESAGGGAVCSLMAAPSAEGLFDRAILMSTVCVATPREEAVETGERIAAELGCADADDVAACLRALPVDELLDAAQVVSPPIQGTATLPTSGWVAMRDGELAPVPVMIGATHDEGRSFLANYADRTAPDFNRAQYEAFARDLFPDHADEVLAVYPWPETPTPYAGTYLAAELFMANLLDFGPGGLSACKTSKFTELLAGRSDAWAYEFAPRGGPGWFETMGGYNFGAGHATDLAYIIPERGSLATNGSALGPEHRQLSDLMIAYWTNLARDGDPNGEGLPRWDAYSPGTGPVMRLREGGRSGPIPTAALRAVHDCEFWESIGHG